MHVQVERLTRAFGRVHALAGVSLSVGAGEIVGLIGPNGAGKSTLLACIAGVDAPDEGRVLVDGAEANASARRQALFYMPDGIAPWRDQRASWVLDFGSEYYGATEAWRSELGPALGLDAFVNRRIGDLSKGRRRGNQLWKEVRSRRDRLPLPVPFLGPLPALVIERDVPDLAANGVDVSSCEPMGQIP